MNIKYKFYKAGIIIALIFSLFSCEKTPNDFRSFLDTHEIYYPGKVSNIQGFSGRNRVLLKFEPNSDPSVSQYIIYWNNEGDSLLVSVKSHDPKDTVSTMISNLNERIYNLTIFSLDKEGDRSVPVSIDGVRVFGNNYRESLLNRIVVSNIFKDNKLSLTWSTPDSVNIGTDVKYTDTLGEVKSIILPANSNNLILKDWQVGKNIYFRSSYKPSINAIDTFRVSHWDSLDLSSIKIPVDKSLWKAVFLPYDSKLFGSFTPMTWMWDGKPNSWPNIYSSKNASIPNTFTIDLGKIYNNLSTFEMWGRLDFNGNNPVEYEVWGIADTAGALLSVKPTNSDWKAESIEKGWTLLAKVIRSDDGTEGKKISLIPNPPPVRFIRVRNLRDYGGENRHATNASEISLWYNL